MAKNALKSARPRTRKAKSLRRRELPPLIFERSNSPGHLSNIRELDFSSDIFAERLEGPWFRLGAQTMHEPRNERGVEEAVSRQSILLAPEGFAEVFDKLESIGDVLSGLGKPSGVVHESGGLKIYGYTPCHRFEFPFASVIAEPLVFLYQDTRGVEFFINPDLWMYLELEERSPGCGIWWDPRRSVDVLIKRDLEGGRLKIVAVEPLVTGAISTMNLIQYSSPNRPSH